ncbi:ATP-binding cassette domain-containing protein [Nonomuraea sp. LPB2021202275-12-8]|uniref:ATP-binding cassette domain-containing protein n=1 Tax=Nonomuraea sp. LPB2021202275-12-8 TaxID=3120159 RepID=UPI00300D4273
MGEPLLELEGLDWEVNGRRRGVPPGPLAVRSGQTAVIAAGDAGEAGMLTDILLGLDWRFRGRIRVSGQEITMRLPEERQIGLVPAGGGLLPHLTVEKNLVLTARDKRGSSDVRGRVGFMAEQMGIEGFLHTRPHELAHDERLAVALARVLCMHRPVKVVLVEDHTGSGPCHAAVSAAMGTDPSLAVVVVTDDRTRVASLASPALFWEVANVDQP